MAVDLTVDSAGTLVQDLGRGGRPPTSWPPPTRSGSSRSTAILTGEPMVLAEDRLVIAVPRGNPGGVRAGRATCGATRWRVCYINEACGRLAQLALDSARHRGRSPSSARTPPPPSAASSTAPSTRGSCSPPRPARPETPWRPSSCPWAGDRVSFPSISLIDGAPDPDDGPGVHRLRARRGRAGDPGRARLRLGGESAPAARGLTFGPQVRHTLRMTGHRRASRRPRVPLVLALAGVRERRRRAPPSERRADLTVLAAASLTDVFTELGADASRPTRTRR